MVSNQKLYISVSDYKERVEGIENCASALQLDESAFPMESEVCKTDAVMKLSGINHSARDLISQHGNHISEELPAFLGLLAESIVETDRTTADNLWFQAEGFTGGII